MCPTPSPEPPERTFTLDDFQREALAAVDAGTSVLVAAPTGSGKTVVAEHAVERTLATGGRVFYTTPIKALSNQKYHDLIRRHGESAVGLLTGDNAVNGDAPVVVMTTEVLRNMLYSGSHALDGLRWVVLDEVHYLQDTYRGPAWEEVIVNLPPTVSLVCLSATVSNVEELADWLRSVRGPTVAVVETRRPVELVHLFGVSDRLAERLTVIPTLVDGRANPEGERYDRNPVGGGGRPARGRPRRRFAPPSRVDVVDWLAEADLVPAIHFIFSRAACDDAVRSCMEAGVRLTEPADRARIDAIVEHHVRRLGDDDLHTLGYERWRAALHAGVAAHHAGMVPPFKEAVEACFTEGLVRVVFATETLALGINMPARTVVVDKLTKYTGERHEFLTPAQFTQLTGRAGRRGLDPIGHALVLWNPFVSFGEVAGLASSRSFPLTSAFRPTYNMAANLVLRHDRQQAEHLLARSFAQFQTDRAVSTLEMRLAERRRDRDRLAEESVCSLGDVAEYDQLRREARTERAQARRADNDAIRSSLAALRPGDVLTVGGTVTGGRAAVLSVSHRRGGGVRVRVIGATRRVVLLGESDLDAPPEVVGRLELPTPFAPRSPSFQKEVVAGLRRMDLPRRSDRRGSGGTRSDTGALEAARSHPVAGCPDLSVHLDALRRLRRLDQACNDLERQVRGRTGSLRRRFADVLALLEQRGYLIDWSLTTRGRMLVSIFHECDLLIAEAVADGLFDGLSPPEVAALASTFVYEHRAPGPAPDPWFPPGPLAERWGRLDRLATGLSADERSHGLPETRRPDPGFIAIAHAWISGGDLAEVLDDEDLTAGDFVRTMKVLLDLLGQIEMVCADPGTRTAAASAARLGLRGLVAASSMVGAEEDVS
jgi:ATP-dependent RNA helicase HelY